MIISHFHCIDGIYIVLTCTRICTQGSYNCVNGHAGKWATHSIKNQNTEEINAGFW